MLATKRVIQFSLLAMALASAIGCARSTGDGGGPPPVPTPPPIASPTPFGRPPSSVPPEERFKWSNGGTTDLIVEDIETMEAYTDRPVNFPNADEGIVLKLNVYFNKDDASGKFGGHINIAYEESDAQGNPVYHEGQFKTGSRKKDIQFNMFTNIDGVDNFKAFTQDDMGGIVIVVDRVVDGMAEGSIYFHNFYDSTGYKPWQFGGEYCWNIKVGTYDCRDFLVGSGSDQNKVVDVGSSLYPNRVKDSNYYYTKLGEFYDLDITKAIKGIDD